MNQGLIDQSSSSSTAKRILRIENPHVRIVDYDICFCCCCYIINCILRNLLGICVIVADKNDGGRLERQSLGTDEVEPLGRHTWPLATVDAEPLEDIPWSLATADYADSSAFTSLVPARLVMSAPPSCLLNSAPLAIVETWAMENQHL